jgi:hypothetical protein
MMVVPLSAGLLGTGAAIRLRRGGICPGDIQCVIFRNLRTQSWKSTQTCCIKSEVEASVNSGYVASRRY